jgi:quinol monooxygenase YgiN
MAEVRVIARAEASDGKAEELKNLLKQLVAPTRTEKGSLSYEFFESNLPGVYFFVERWASQEDLAVHAGAERFKAVIAKAAGLVKIPFEVNIVKAAE